MTATLVLTCFQGHALATLAAENERLTWTPRQETQEVLSVLRRDWASTQELLIAEAAQLREEAESSAEIMSAVAGAIVSLEGDWPAYLAELEDRIADAEEGAEALAKPRAGHSGASATLTPDRGAIAWACLSCFRAGISGAMHKRRGTYHHGQAPVRPFLRVLTVLGDRPKPLRLIATESSARAWLRQQPPETPKHHRRTSALAASLADVAAPTEEDMAEWRRTQLTHPSSWPPVAPSGPQTP